MTSDDGGADGGVTHAHESEKREGIIFAESIEKDILLLSSQFMLTLIIFFVYDDIRTAVGRSAAGNPKALARPAAETLRLAGGGVRP